MKQLIYVTSWITLVFVGLHGRQLTNLSQETKCHIVWDETHKLEDGQHNDMNSQPKHWRPLGSLEVAIYF